MKANCPVCPAADLLSYNMPQGNRRGTDIDLFDFTYDGKVQDNYLSGGLGQLIDGVIGDRNFRTAPSDVGHKGYDWVGWKNDTIDRPPVEIILTFAHMRNFSSVRIHCNNMFNKDVRVFRMAKLFFSIGGQHYPPNPVVFHYMRDTLMEFPRNAIITIPHRVGRYVKLQLFFDARWILISEISFESSKCHCFVLYIFIFLLHIIFIYYWHFRGFVIFSVL